MIRQAHTYLAGAMGGATLIALAIAVFVVLVSAQVFRDWPIAALGGDGDENAAVSKAQPAGFAAADVAPGSGGGVGSATGDAGQTGSPARAGLRDNTGSATVRGGIKSAEGGQGTTEPGGQGGSAAAGSPQAPKASSPAGSTGTASSGGGGGGGKSSSSGPGASGDPSSSPSSQVTETVNNTVKGVDESALGDALGNGGATNVTEGVVNGVAGPESPLGKVVDEAAGTVGGLLPGNR